MTKVGFRAGLGIRLFAHRSFARSINSLRSNEWLWAICSDRSGQMSDREQIAQVAHDIRATVTDSLRLLMINERMSEWLIFWQIACFFWANHSFTLMLTKTSNLLKKFDLNHNYWYVYCSFKKKKFNERFAHSLFFNERCERIAQVAYQKWAMWVNRSGRSPKMSDHEQIAQVAHQKWVNEKIALFLRKSIIRSFFAHFSRKKRHCRLFQGLDNGWGSSLLKH